MAEQEQLGENKIVIPVEKIFRQEEGKRLETKSVRRFNFAFMQAVPEKTANF